MKARMGGGDRRLPILGKDGMFGAAMLHGGMRNPDLPGREPGVPGPGKDVEKARILQRLKTGEGTCHPHDSAAEILLVKL
jgi:hypothetical protein